MFQALVTFSLRQRVFVLAAAVILVGWGVVLGRHMTIDLLPETRQPQVVIVTTATGYATQEVEQIIGRPIELAMGGVPGVERVRGNYSAGTSVIFVSFQWGTDPYHNRQMVAERLAMVQPHLPPGISPLLAPMAGAAGLIMQTNIYGPDPMALRDYVDWVLRPHLMAIPGVAMVTTLGGEVRTFRFVPNPMLMLHYHVSLQEVKQALQNFGTNSPGGYADISNQEYTLRNVGHTMSLDDMRNVVVKYNPTSPQLADLRPGLALPVGTGVPVVLGQLGTVEFAPKVKRADGAFDGKPSVNLQIVRQPDANTVQVTAAVQQALAKMQKTAPPGVKLGMEAYNQADMINEAIGNVGHVLRDAAIIVSIVLFAFLASLRPTIVSLLAIPISLVVSIIVFHLMGSTLNTMTLGGIAIGLGALVDDAVVDVENILRRLGENRKKTRPEPIITVIARASQEVRSGIVYATVIVLLVFVPLYFLPGHEGRLFMPLATAYVVSMFISLAVSITVTPALASYLFPSMKSLSHEHGGWFARWLKRRNDTALHWVLDHPRTVVAIAGAAVISAMASMPFLPRSFLPEFNEGDVYVNFLLNPETSLSASYRIGHLAEQLVMQIPEVKALGRRTGHFEDDTEPDPVSENDMVMKVRYDHGRTRQEVMDDIRRRLSVFSADTEVTQQLQERINEEDNGVKGDIVVKIYGNDLKALLSLAEGMRTRLARIPGLVDVVVEQQQFTPQVRIAVDYARAKLFGVTPAAITDALAALSDGYVASSVIDNGRRFDVVIRLDDTDRTPQGLSLLRLDTPTGPIPLSSIANVQLTEGPGQILTEDGQRRIAVMADSDGSDMARIVAAIRKVMAATTLPENYQTSLEGGFREGEEGRQAMSILAPVSLLLIFLVLQQRYRSPVLCLIIMGNIPLALAGAVAALWISGQDFSLAALIGFIAVTGVAVRNSLLKVSHFINLHLHEGMPLGRELLLRGCSERLMPVLMTALSAGFGLIPLLFKNDIAGTEILHPVAIAIFGGLISSTLLDTFTTPVLFQLFGERAVQKTISADARLAHETF